MICFPRRICFNSPRFFHPFNELKILIITSLAEQFYIIFAKNQDLIEKNANILYKAVCREKTAYYPHFYQ
jgi:hypothetical protein